MIDDNAHLSKSTTRRIWLDRLHDAWDDFAPRHQNAVRALAAISCIVIVFTGWFLYQVLSGLPGKEQLRELGEAVEGTVL